MAEKDIQKQLEEINQKLDFITRHMERHERRQREWDELKADLALISKDMFQAAVVELDEVAQHFETRDLFYLIKKLMRNTRHLIKVLDQLEGASDFLRDAAPLTKEIFDQWLETLQELERKGYFEFFGEAFKIIDTIVTSFTVEDVRQLRENITFILMTIKNLTQPEMLSTINNAVGFYKKMDIDINEKITYRQLFKELLKPETKVSLAFLLQFLKNMASTNGKNEKQLTPKTDKEEHHA